VPPGTIVRLVVEAECVVVPKVLRRYIKDAMAVLQKERLRWQEKSKPTGTANPGTVLDQNPQPGECVPPGTVVELFVEMPAN